MREYCTYGSARGAAGNRRPYRNHDYCSPVVDVMRVVCWASFHSAQPTRAGAPVLPAFTAPRCMRKLPARCEHLLFARGIFRPFMRAFRTDARVAFFIGVVRTALGKTAQDASCL